MTTMTTHQRSSRRRHHAVFALMVATVPPGNNYAFANKILTPGWIQPPCSLPKARTLRSCCRCQDGPGDWVVETILNSNALSLEQFKRRRDSIELKALKNQIMRPPNPFLGPTEFVTEILRELRLPVSRSSGVLTLLLSSTLKWRETLVHSVGAPVDAEDVDIAPSLEAALGRLNNQFGILVGSADSEEFVITFPSEPLDYQDGTCWVECRLRGANDDQLLVATGWSLEQRPSDGAFLVHSIDWQDFREAYRPGIGREEWERICG
jgi:hypothetical protein